ncbi:MAG: FAD-dependent oxidoreductase [Thermodesulfobacteriota bacterium]|jgi:fumarate reductase flavoprotein subunit
MIETRKEVDLVVIGSGVTGLVAALTAAEGGAKVIVFEKQRSLGGSSNFFYGIFAVESEMQRERYITYSRDQAFKNIMEYSHWRANPRLVKAIVNESGATITWLQQQGVDFTDARINFPEAPMTYHVVKGQGAAVVKALSEKAKEKGVNLRTETPVRKILKRGDRIAGVIVKENKQPTEVAASMVVVASGGYANNKEWIKKYSGFDLGVNVIPVGNVDKMGDGIRMAWEIGAAEEGLGVLEMYRVGPVGPEFPMMGQLEFIPAQPDLWINQSGERFCDESIAFSETSAGNANARHKEGYTYSLFDDSIKQLILDKGIERGVGEDNLPGTRPVNFDKELHAALERGTTELFVANSIEEMARKMGIDPVVLKATVGEYNRFCDKGHDDLFAKNPKYLRPLRGPKFYAVKARTIYLGTLGGIKINHNMEVVDKKDRIIPGLYAGGFDAGGMYGDSYCIHDSSGLSSGFAVNSGRIAGRNALRYIGR